MGSSNLNCAISNFPINRGEKVVCLILVKPKNYDEHKSPYYPWGQWKVASLPFVVEMGDYSCPIGVLDCEGSESGEFDTFNPFDKVIYELSRKYIYVYSTKDKQIIEYSTKTGHRGHWFHISRYGDYDKNVGYDTMYNPEQLSKTQDNFRFLYRFNPKDVSCAFINLKVWKYLSQPKPVIKTGEYFELVDNFLNIIKKIHETKDFDLKMELRMESTGDRFEFFDNFAFREYWKLLLDKAEHISDFEVKFKQLYAFSYNLWNIQHPLVPSHGLAPQCGWHNDLKAMNNFNKTLVKLYNQRQEKMNEEA